MWRGPSMAGGVLRRGTGKDRTRGGTAARNVAHRRCTGRHRLLLRARDRSHSKSDRWVSSRGDPPWVDHVRESRPKMELEASYGNLRVGKVRGCVERERRLWRVDVRRWGAVGSLGQPVASRRMGAFAIQRIREKIRQGEMDISDKSHKAAVTKMKRRQWPPIGVRIEIDYFGFVTGRMRRRATGGPVALEALFGWVARGRASPRWTAEVGTFLTNSGKSADVSWRKTGRIEAVKIVPEEDVPEGNKEALEKREETETSGVEKSQVSLPRCSGQRGLHNMLDSELQQ
ncbi:hypothetical protein T01_8685 [Trichinella spiralis]|uniref:Uncharacterized protein n=1 Tax=Trichinella spiralis TaxID=6334 RepID=A0A0V1BHZ9_TRISP|nr:hypothetical protein T01_8685 [Trichinella spiralis]